MDSKFYEELWADDEFTHLSTRTVTENHNMLLKTLILNRRPLHFDEEFANYAIQGKILIKIVFTVAIEEKLFVSDTTKGPTIENLGFNKTALQNNLFAGASGRASTRVIGTKQSSTETDISSYFQAHSCEPTNRYRLFA